MVDLVAAQTLEQAATVADLLPVDAEAADAAASRLRSIGTTLEAVTEELRALQSAPRWLGDAGRSFERRVADCPDHARRGAGVFRTAGAAFADLAPSLAAVRPDVIAAFNLWQLAREQSRRWQADVVEAFQRGHSPPGLTDDDPGQATAARAITIYARARQRMEAATERAMRTLLLAAQAAPGAREFMDRPSPLESARGFALGVGDFALASGQFVYDFNAIRAALDPEGMRDDARGVAAGLGHLIRNPGDLDDVLLDLDLLREDPARWLGTILAPTILLAPLSRAPALSIDTTARIAARLGRPGEFVTRHLDDLEELDRLATALRLPSPGTLAKLGEPALLQQAIDSARRSGPHADDDFDRLAEQHGGHPDDYERKVATVSLDADHDLTFEFVHNAETNEVFEPRVVDGTIEENCRR